MVSLPDRVLARSQAAFAIRMQPSRVTLRMEIAMSGVGMNSPRPMYMLRSA